MTQEEKVKAYDELKVKASRIYHKENDVLIMHTIEDLFPELKESEDEKIRKNLIGYIKGISKNEVCEETKDSWIAWLEKQGEQKPWSEEDEDILNTIINHFEIDLECTENDDIIKWFKSLRPQNKWKPSDEQMLALHDINLTGGISYAGQGQELISLYNDLKKLREE